MSGSRRPRPGSPRTLKTSRKILSEFLVFSLQKVRTTLYSLHNSTRRHLEKIGRLDQTENKTKRDFLICWREDPSAERYLIYLFTLEIWIRILMIFIGKISLPTLGVYNK